MRSMTTGKQIIEIRSGHIMFHAWYVIDTSLNDHRGIAWSAIIPHANNPADAWANFLEWWERMEPSRTMSDWKKEGYRAKRFTVTITQEATRA